MLLMTNNRMNRIEKLFKHSLHFFFLSKQGEFKDKKHIMSQEIIKTC